MQRVEQFLTDYLADPAAAVAAVNLAPQRVDDGRFYVYALIDPRDYSVFYVGKGTGNRVNQHVSEARRGKVSNSAKHRRITEIEAEGMRVCELVLIDGLHERDAFAAERRLIGALKDRGLTNIKGGTATNEEVKRLRAAELLARLKPRDIWLATVDTTRMSPVLVGGQRLGPVELYDRTKSELEGIANGTIDASEVFVCRKAA